MYVRLILVGAEPARMLDFCRVCPQHGSFVRSFWVKGDPSNIAMPMLTPKAIYTSDLRASPLTFNDIFDLEGNDLGRIHIAV